MDDSKWYPEDDDGNAIVGCIWGLGLMICFVLVLALLVAIFEGLAS